MNPIRWIVLGLASLLVACAPQATPERDVALTENPKYGTFIWHDLITDDVAAAKAFYGPLLGWRFEDTVRPAGGPYTLIRAADGAYVGGMIEVEDPEDGTDFSRWLGYYAVPSVDEAARTFVESGGEVVAHPRDLGEVARAAVVRDPDGALVGLITSRIGYPIDELSVDPGAVIGNELVTANPQSAAELYASLAASTVQVAEQDGVTRWQLRAEGRERALVLARPDERIEPLWLTFFAVEDAPGVARRAAELGGAVVLAPSAAVRGGALALLTDPTGAVLGVQEKR